MGSVPASDVILNDALDTDSVVPKIEPGQDNYDSPSVSSLDDEQDGIDELRADKSSNDPPPPPPKRKGGRKPVSRLVFCFITLLKLLDLCHIGGEEAAQPSSSGCLP